MKLCNLKDVLKVLLAFTVVVLGANCGGPMPAPVPAMSAPGGALGSAAAEVSYATEPVNRRSRPGLGTGWGEEKASSISYTSFTRASTKPKAVEVIYYNDEEGVKAMAGPHSTSDAGLVKSSHGLVEWGVKSGWGYSKNVYASGKRFVVGEKDKSYSLVIRNLSYSRLEVVLSVDGLDVMDGKLGSVKKRGYIIAPGSTLKVDGFRTSEDAVAAFKFSSVGNSYSNLRHGTTRNVGVIGMAVFTEKGVDPWKWSKREVERRKGASPFAEAPPVRAR